MVTADALAALDAATSKEDGGEASGLKDPPIDSEDLFQNLLHSLHAAEASAKVNERLAGLQMEFDRLAALTPGDASTYQQYREHNAAVRLQATWRRRNHRLAFLDAIRIAVEEHHSVAAITIQRAHRTRQRIVREAAPPISQARVKELTATIATRTIAMATELKVSLAGIQVRHSVGAWNAWITAPLYT